MLYFDENVVDIERNESEKTFPLLFKYIGDEGNERTNYLYHNPEFKWLKIYSDDGSEHLGYICITFNHFHDLSMGQNQSCHISILEIKDKGQGLGTQVMNDVFAFAKDNNFKYITLQAKNDRVRDWYMKLGFYYSIDKSFLIKQVSFEIPNYEHTLNESKHFKEDNITTLARRIDNEMKKNNCYEIDKCLDRIITINSKCKEDEQNYAEAGAHNAGLFITVNNEIQEVRTPTEALQLIRDISDNYPNLQKVFETEEGQTSLLSILNAYYYGNEYDNVPLRFIYPKLR